MFYPAFLPCHLVLGDILPVQGFHCHGAGCDAARQADYQDELEERGERAGARAFVAVLTLLRLLPRNTRPPGSPSAGTSGAAWLERPARAGGPQPRAGQARPVWAVKEQSRTGAPLGEGEAAPAMMVHGVVAVVRFALELGSSCFTRFLFCSFAPPGHQFVFHSCL